jgi:hypothetical protein
MEGENWQFMSGGKSGRLDNNDVTVGCAATNCETGCCGVDGTEGFSILLTPLEHTLEGFTHLYSLEVACSYVGHSFIGYVCDVTVLHVDTGCANEVLSPVLKVLMDPRLV